MRSNLGRYLLSTRGDKTGTASLIFPGFLALAYHRWASGMIEPSLRLRASTLVFLDVKAWKLKIKQI